MLSNKVISNLFVKITELILRYPLALIERSPNTKKLVM